MLKRVVILLVMGGAMLAVAGLFLSPEFTIQQSVEIKARPEIIHAYVNDLKQWPRWTAWKGKGTDMVIRYGDVTRGVGASQHWQGTAGHGRLHITVSSPLNGIAYDMFFDEDKNPSISAIEYKVLDANLTRVTWRLHGEIERPVLGGYLATFVRFMTRDRYQKGLSNLKMLIESDTPPR